MSNVPFMTLTSSYDETTEMMRATTQADAVIAMVVNGKRGSGVSVQCSGQFAPGLMDDLPGMLEQLAREMRSAIDVQKTRRAKVAASLTER